MYIKRRYVGRKLYVGGGKTAAFPPQNPPPTAIYEGLRPSNSPYCIIYYFRAPQKRRMNKCI